mmetsp:Transcript_138011/g.440231  ORF Transcript_138011/g.440231 Transcript_138011/m.440231 type:complete len:228 (-) Transcript_138011:47-730(-)
MLLASCSNHRAQDHSEAAAQAPKTAVKACTSSPTDSCCISATRFRACRHAPARLQELMAAQKTMTLSSRRSPRRACSSLLPLRSIPARSHGRVEGHHSRMLLGPLHGPHQREGMRPGLRTSAGADLGRVDDDVRLQGPLLHLVQEVQGRCPPPLLFASLDLLRVGEALIIDEVLGVHSRLALLARRPIDRCRVRMSGGWRRKRAPGWHRTRLKIHQRRAVESQITDT